MSNIYNLPTDFVEGIVETLDATMPTKVTTHKSLDELRSCLQGYVYVVTITLNPKKWMMSSTKQLMIMKDKLHTYLRKRNFNYYFIPELQKNGNVHLHGWISKVITNHNIELVDHQVSLFSNWASRIFGPQRYIFRVYDMYSEYSDIDYKFKKRKTSFLSQYKYIHKGTIYNSFYCIA